MSLKYWNIAFACCGCVAANVPFLSRHFAHLFVPMCRFVETICSAFCPNRLRVRGAPAATMYIIPCMGMHLDQAQVRTYVPISCHNCVIVFTVLHPVLESCFPEDSWALVYLYASHIQSSQSILLLCVRTYNIIPGSMLIFLWSLCPLSLSVDPLQPAILAFKNYVKLSRKAFLHQKINEGYFF